MKYDNNGMLMPDYESCTTTAAIETEFDTWIETVCLAKFCEDENIKNDDGAKQAYQKTSEVIPKKFWTPTDEKGTHYYYFGTDTKFKAMLKQQKSNRDSFVRTKRLKDGVASSNNGIKKILQGKDTYTPEQKSILQSIALLESGTRAQAIEEFNKRYATDISTKSTKEELLHEIEATDNSGIFGNVSTTWASIKNEISGRNIYTTEQQSELLTIAGNENLSDGDRAKAIEEFNKKYNTEIKTDLSGEGLKKEAMRHTGSLEDIFSSAGALIFKRDTTIINTDTTKSTTSAPVNISDIWNKSSDKNIQAFVSKGITGDVAWGVIVGKYNGNDEECKTALEELAQKVNNEELTKEQKQAAVKELSNKYGLNLDESITADQIAEVINNLQRYRYKNQVRNIATQIIEEKINDQINNKLQEQLGGTLARLGIDFSFKGRNTIQEIKDIVRGVKVVTFNKDKFLKGLQDQLEKKIAKAIEEKVYDKLDEAAKKMNTAIDKTSKRITEGIVNSSVYRTVDTINTQLLTWTKNPESFTLAIADRLDAAIKSPVDKVAGILDKLDAPFKKLGLDGLGLGSMFKEITQVYTKGYAEKIREAISPVLQKALAVTATVRKAFQNLVATVNKLRDQAKALVEKWKNTIKDAIAKQTQQLVNELVKYVKVKVISGIGDVIKI